MTEIAVIRQLLRDLLKPIIAEAIAEASEQEKKNPRHRFYTRQETCELLHIGTTTFYRMAGKGKIKILKIEGKTLVDADELDAAIETRSIFRYQH